MANLNDITNNDGDGNTNNSNACGGGQANIDPETVIVFLCFICGKGGSEGKLSQAKASSYPYPSYEKIAQRKGGKALERFEQQKNDDGSIHYHRDCERSSVYVKIWEKTKASGTLL